MSNASRRIRVVTLLGTVIALMATAYSAYKGHADDTDVNAILTAYPKLIGSATDSCATCHKGGNVADSSNSGALREENPCGYCHFVHVKNKSNAKVTLNSYGTDYLAAGRGVKAVKAIARKDSDTDGFSNEDEFLEGTNPGESASNPSARIAPYRIYTASELKATSPVVSETVFLNTTKNRQGDFYNEYRGNRVYELLQAAGISDAAKSVDFISLDGFEGTFTLDELKKAWPQGAPIMGLGKQDIGPCGWVHYNAAGIEKSSSLPQASILLAFEENGRKIETGKLDPETGRIIGTGPLRLIVPQFRISPPDLPEYAGQSCQDRVLKEYHFNEDYDHNGGKSSFCIVAIRIKPLPKGTRDFDWQSIRNQLVTDEKIVLFGALKKSAASVTHGNAR